MRESKATTSRDRDERGFQRAGRLEEGAHRQIDLKDIAEAGDDAGGE